MEPHPRILATYTDAHGVERTAPDWAVERFDSVLREQRTGRYVDVVRLRAGESTGDLARTPLTLEDGGEVVLGDSVPHDLPHGYHELQRDDGRVLVLHAPERMPEVSDSRGWVLAAQLYSARSERSWGHGDLADARRMSDWVAEGGESPGFLMLNPLHAAIPGPSPQPSPYFASSRIFRNPIYVAVEDLPGLADLPRSERSKVQRRAAKARALNSERLIDRTAAWGLKRQALQLVWDHVRTRPEVSAAVDQWLADPVQLRFAAYSAGVEATGSRPPTGDETVQRWGSSPEARFHAWLQIVTEEQVRAAGGNLINDVAVGTDRAGADTWLWPECYVLDGTVVGCPPDAFNTQGQDWGLPPFHPDGLRAAGYEPFRRAVASAAAGAAGIRIDHVMGLERLFYIPEESSPHDGAYVTFDLDEMLDVVSIEAHRAGVFVVGEDLGTVSPRIYEAIPQRGMLSYRVMSIDDRHPSTFPQHSMAASTTHDLPTLMGLMGDTDLADQERLDLKPNTEGTRAARDRLRHWAGIHDGSSDRETLVAAHRLLASSPACLVAATLEDLALMVERPNMPGTIDIWPNWSWGLPSPLEEVLADPAAVAVRSALSWRPTPGAP